MSIKILLTGGTIDKSYNESNGELNFTKTHIPELFELGRNRADINIEKLMLKDSLQMDDADRQDILRTCIKTNEDKIIITHGTDTMVETANVLGKAVVDQKLNKTMVLVGAMVPFVFKHSDAIFNMGFALASVQTLEHGVYITMNGKVFDWNKVEKNRELGVFDNREKK